MESSRQFFYIWMREKLVKVSNFMQNERLRKPNILDTITFEKKTKALDKRYSQTSSHPWEA